MTSINFSIVQTYDEDEDDVIDREKELHEEGIVEVSRNRFFIYE